MRVFEYKFHKMDVLYPDDAQNLIAQYGLTGWEFAGSYLYQPLKVGDKPQQSFNVLVFKLERESEDVEQVVGAAPREKVDRYSATQVPFSPEVSASVATSDKRATNKRESVR